MTMNKKFVWLYLLLLATSGTLLFHAVNDMKTHDAYDKEVTAITKEQKDLKKATEINEASSSFANVKAAELAKQMKEVETKITDTQKKLTDATKKIEAQQAEIEELKK